MSEGVRLLECDPARLLKAFIDLDLHSAQGNQAFKEDIYRLADTMPAGKPMDHLKGLSLTNIKKMRKKEASVSERISSFLAAHIFRKIGIDVTREESLRGFFEIGFDVQLEMNVVSINTEDGSVKEHDLQDFHFEVHEAPAVGTSISGDDFELSLRIGFERARLSLHGNALRIIGNQVAGQTSLTPDEPHDPGYTGWFTMRFAGRSPVNWTFDPRNEVDLLDGRVDAEKLVRVQVAQGSSLVAELTVKRDALKVRVLDRTGSNFSKSLSEQHREKMCAAVARKSLSNGAEEYLIHRKVLVHPDASEST